MVMFQFQSFLSCLHFLSLSQHQNDKSTFSRSVVKDSHLQVVVDHLELIREDFSSVDGRAENEALLAGNDSPLILMLAIVTWTAWKVRLVGNFILAAGPDQRTRIILVSFICKSLRKMPL